LFEAGGHPGGHQAAIGALSADDVGFDAASGQPSRQEGPGWFAQDLPVTVHMSLTLSEPQGVEIPCVLGYLPGSDYDLAGQLVVLYAPYDGLGIDPDGTTYPAVNHNASSVAVLLEMARLWQEQNLDARRSVMFVAWGGGQLQEPGAERFVRQSTNFRHLPTAVPNKPALLLQLEGVGAAGESADGSVGELWIHPQSNRHLAELIEETAAEVGVPVAHGESNAFPGETERRMVTRRIPSIYLTWSDSDIAPNQDTLERIEPDRLRAVGEALALALTKVVRQTSY
jgi:Zn-dependent M28 family amino/carboxypeptidase